MLIVVMVMVIVVMLVVVVIVVRMRRSVRVSRADVACTWRAVLII